jgi:hypothetical protein
MLAFELRRTMFVLNLFKTPLEIWDRDEIDE